MERIISCADAIREGLTEAARRDPNVIFFAEGVADPTAVFGTLSGIGAAIGHHRMIEMPIAENALTGIAIGSTLSGLRPVISFHRVEFALLAMEQIVNNAAKLFYASNGRHSVPMVIRLVAGRGWGQGPAHSQTLESIFAHFPGLKVMMPTFPADAKALIAGAVEDDNPVIVIEQRWCHYVTGHVPEGHLSLPLGGPKVVRPGKDLTIVASSYMTLEAMLAADCLLAVGIDAEVLDLRVIRPLNMTPIVESVRKTGHVLTVDTGWKTFGVGAEIVSQLVDTAFAALKSSPKRLGLPDHPTPSSRGLVEGFYPDARQIVEQVGVMLGLSKDHLAPAFEKVSNAVSGRLVDVPVPAFRGPF